MTVIEHANFQLTTRGDHHTLRFVDGVLSSGDGGGVGVASRIMSSRCSPSKDPASFILLASMLSRLARSSMSKGSLSPEPLQRTAHLDASLQRTAPKTGEVYKPALWHRRTVPSILLAVPQLPARMTLGHVLIYTWLTTDVIRKRAYNGTRWAICSLLCFATNARSYAPSQCRAVQGLATIPCCRVRGGHTGPHHRQHSSCLHHVMDSALLTHQNRYIASKQACGYVRRTWRLLRMPAVANAMLCPALQQW